MIIIPEVQMKKKNISYPNVNFIYIYIAECPPKYRLIREYNYQSLDNKYFIQSNANKKSI